ncbi:arginase family protein [Leucobacter insecticola]|uniref:Arginase family protein n=1 Tax=Leucobacter insecticola TaxID=2714934 RepID=A0A6G8FKM2_9MICO|nr:arginase family protein [Leucobacter insecticola]QIM16839.1 arginase family protein [Leucobacter insecticola]
MSKPVFLLVPEWQGSDSSRAMQLTDGAALLREDLPRSALTEVAVPLEAGDALGTPVARLSSVLQARDATRRALAEIDATPIIVGGDCATSLPGIEAAARAHGDGLAVLWCNAHPHAQHPSTSPSGAASGMTLRHALGDGSPDLISPNPITPSQVTFVGTRAFDPEEEEFLRGKSIAMFGADDPDLKTSVMRRLKDAGATHLYVHIDLDVLDPAEFSAVHSAVPFGLSVSQLTEVIRAAVALLPLAGGAICEFAPSDPANAADNQPTVLRVLAALTSGSAA